MARFCTNCGAEIHGNGHFCTKCGAPVAGGTGGTYPAPQSTLNKTDQAFFDMVKNDYFSYEGRLNRKPYFLRSLIIIAIAVALYILLFMDSESLADTMSIPIWLAVVVSDAMLSIRRLHDLDKSGYLYLLTLIPGVNSVFGIYLLVAPGTPGDNQYGPDPLRVQD